MNYTITNYPTEAPTSKRMIFQLNKCPYDQYLKSYVFIKAKQILINDISLYGDNYEFIKSSNLFGIQKHDDFILIKLPTVDESEITDKTKQHRIIVDLDLTADDCFIGTM